MIPTLEPGKPLRVAFGSCRVSVSHDDEGNAEFGVDALRAFALRMAGVTGEPDAWPDLVVFLGDQVYADDTSPKMKEFIAARRDPTEPPWTELKDYDEYAHLYRLAWSDPANRWLLSTLPSAMIFDDHDIRDDWNTSLDWRREMEATDVVARAGRGRARVVLGPPAPRQPRPGRPRRGRALAADRGVRRPGELDVTEELDRLADRADRAAGLLPLELLPRLRRPGAPRRRGLPRGPGARAREALDARRRRSSPGWTSGCAATSTT